MKVDPKKEYITGGGLRVINITIVPRNCIGELVTYPIKGSIVTSEKPLRLSYDIWAMDGRSNVVWPDPLNDLKEV